MGQKAVIEEKPGLTFPGLRPNKRTFTIERQLIILQAIEKGLPMTIASGKAGVPYRTLCDWLNWGERSALDHFDSDGEIDLNAYGEFYLAKYRAEAENVEAMLDKLAGENGAFNKPEHWPSVITWLERVYPNTFGRRQSLQVQQDTTLTINVHRLDGDDWKRRTLEGEDTGGVIDSQLLSPVSGLLEAGEELHVSAD